MSCRTQEPGPVLYLGRSPEDTAAVQRILAAAGLHVDVVDSPSKALGRLRHVAYGALLIDQRLGRFDGAEIVLHLRDLEIALPPTFVISESREARERAVENGASGILSRRSPAGFTAALLAAIGAEQASPPR